MPACREFAATLVQLIASILSPAQDSSRADPAAAFPSAVQDRLVPVASDTTVIPSEVAYASRLPSGEIANGGTLLSGRPRSRVSDSFVPSGASRSS